MIQKYTVKYASLVVLVGALAGVSACSGTDDPKTIDPGIVKCERDDISEPALAQAFNLAEPTSGFVCPEEDQDWYRITLTDQEKIARVSLSMSVPLSQIEPTYAFYTINSAGEPETVVASPPATSIGAKLNDVHCMEAGEYLFVVRDQGDNAEDFRHPYTVTVTGQPDPDLNEPNNEQATAHVMSSGSSVQAAIACGGDEDYYKVEIPQGVILRMKLTAPIAGYEPTLLLLDDTGQPIVTQSNPSGGVQETNIDRYEVVPGAGTYYILVKDDDNADANPDVLYTLLVELVTDQDPNEPNNHPSVATPLSASAVTCSGSWSTSMEFQGTIGSPGDNDWYELPLSGCNNGIIEAEVVLNNNNLPTAEQWAFNEKIQATVSLIRPHAESPCVNDQDCITLNKSCEDSWDCAGYFNTCLPEQLCSGASVCLPSGSCGALETQRRYQCSPTVAECQPNSGAQPPVNKAVISAPLFGDGHVYLRVSDFQADGGAPDVLYTLKVRVRTDPDANERSNLYANELPPVIPVWRQPAVDIPIHDCTIGDCCDSGTWVTGVLAYESDMDWYRYPHPCPGQDCTARVVYDVDGGPVDFTIRVSRQTDDEDSWFPVLRSDEAANQVARSGALGGSSAGDSCFYAFSGHSSSNGYYYYVSVRDVLALYNNSGIVRPDSRDWSTDQTYRFCVEKVDNACLEPPCQIYETGCGVPQQ